MERALLLIVVCSSLIIDLRAQSVAEIEIFRRVEDAALADDRHSVYKRVTGTFTERSQQLEAEGLLQHIHPMQLCSEHSVVSDDFYGSVLIIKLELPSQTFRSRRCLSTMDQVSRSFQFGAEAVILITTSYPEIQSELSDEIALFPRPVVIVDSAVEEDKLFAISQAQESAYARISSVKTISEPENVEKQVDPSQQGTRLVYVILSSAAGVVLLLLAAVCSLAVRFAVSRSDGENREMKAVVTAV